MERSCVERSNSLHNNVYFFYSFVYNLINIMCDFPLFFSRRETLDAVEFLIYRIKRYLSKL